MTTSHTILVSSLGYNSSHYNITHDPYFLASDTILTVNSQNSGRVHLGILVNWQMSRRFDIRFYPLNLIFTEKKLVYTQKFPNQGDDALTQAEKGRRHYPEFSPCR